MNNTPDAKTPKTRKPSTKTMSLLEEIKNLKAELEQVRILNEGVAKHANMELERARWIVKRTLQLLKVKPEHAKLALAKAAKEYPVVVHTQKENARIAAEQRARGVVASKQINATKEVK